MGVLGGKKSHGKDQSGSASESPSPKTNYKEMSETMAADMRSINDTNRKNYEYALRQYNKTIYPGPKYADGDHDQSTSTSSPTRSSSQVNQTSQNSSTSSHLNTVTPKAQNKASLSSSSAKALEKAKRRTSFQDRKIDFRIIDESAPPPPPPVPLTKSRAMKSSNDDNADSSTKKDKIHVSSLSYSHSSTSARSAPSDENVQNRIIQHQDSSSTMDDYSDSSSSSSSTTSFKRGNMSSDVDNPDRNFSGQHHQHNADLQAQRKLPTTNEQDNHKQHQHHKSQPTQQSRGLAIDSTSSFIYSYPDYPGSPVKRYNASSHSSSTSNKNNNHYNMEHENSNSSINSHAPYHLHQETSLTPTSAMYHSTEPEMVDVTYEEKYGEAYVNKPIRYIYPEGYHHLRPKSRPWQISVVLFCTFAWLNIYIVGHCSDKFENYYNDGDDDNGDDDNDGGNGNNGNNAGYYYGQYFDDDRWCGSRTLYFTWAMSVVITALSCAYCSFFGYIKARDFSVANNRSQQPGMVGRSDYYVQIEEEINCKGNMRFSSRKVPRGDESFGGGVDSTYSSYQGDGQLNGQGKRRGWFKKTLYQADGTPRYFGGRIYRPTQAAVNITSR